MLLPAAKCICYTMFIQIKSISYRIQQIIMTAAQYICMVSDVKEAEMRRFDVGSKGIIIARVKNQFYAFAEMCTHEDVSLYNGALKQYCVECPLHSSLFDIRTGLVILDPASEAIQTYKLNIEDDKLYIEL